MRAGAGVLLLLLFPLLSLATSPRAMAQGTAPVRPAGAEPEAPAAGDTFPVTVVRGATLVDGTGAPPIDDAALVLEGGRVRAVGRAEEMEVPAGARVVEAAGRWIVPGLIDAHVHFSQTGWFDGRPDALDLRDLHPYPEVAARLREDPGRFLRAYLCSGVTTVFDVGGYPWTLALQGDRPGAAETAKAAADGPAAPRVVATGPLLSTVDFWLNLPDARQFAYMEDAAGVRETVRELADLGAAAIKVWYIFPPQPPDTARARKLLRVAVEAAEGHDLPVVAHATGLWQAKDAVRAGARVLVHSVFEEEVDREFVRLLRDRGVTYVPTITVAEGYANAFAGLPPSELPYPTTCVDSDTRRKLRGGIPEGRDPPPERLAAARARAARRTETALANLARLHEAGVRVALGTDAGNPGTLHGPSVHREMELYREAGLSPMAVLVAATRNAARAAGRGEDLGTLEAGKRADFLILEEDPSRDLAALRRIASVWVGGRSVWPPMEDMTPPDPAREAR